MSRSARPGAVTSDTLPWISLVAFLGAGAGLTVLGFVRFSGPEAVFVILALGYFLHGAAFNVFMTLLSLSGIRQTRRMAVSSCDGVDGAHGTVTVAVPAHNEEPVILPCVRALLDQGAVAEVIVVNDGSTDGTLRVLRDAFELEVTPPSPALPDRSRRRVLRSQREPRLVVLDGENSGKASALNRALAHATGDIFVTCDADCVFHPDAVAKIRRYFTADPLLIAAGGIVTPANGHAYETLTQHRVGLPKGFWPRLQWIEYATSVLWRFGWARIRSLMLLSGSFSAFRRECVLQVGGFDPASVTEDYEIVYRLHDHHLRRSLPYRVMMAPDALAFTLVPETLLDFIRQRIRWFQGFVETVIKYRHLIFKRGTGWFGTFTMPTKALDAVMPLWGIAAYSLFMDNLIFGHLAVCLSVFATVIALRWSTDVGNAWVLLWLRNNRIAPRVGARDLALTMAFSPINLLVQRAAWYVYGVLAYGRIVTNTRKWDKSLRRGFHRDMKPRT